MGFGGIGGCGAGGGGVDLRDGRKFEKVYRK